MDPWGRDLIRCHSHRWVLQKCHRGHLQPHGLSHCTWVRWHFLKPVDEGGIIVIISLGFACSSVFLGFNSDCIKPAGSNNICKRKHLWVTGRTGAAAWNLAHQPGLPQLQWWSTVAVRVTQDGNGDVIASSDDELMGVVAVRLGFWVVEVGRRRRG
jgi:hypothetical protein